MVWAHEGINLSEANDMIWEHKIACLPILDDAERLKYLVFRRDYEERKNNPDSLLDENKRYIVGAGINTRDYEERIPALVDAGVDLKCKRNVKLWAFLLPYNPISKTSNFNKNEGMGAEPEEISKRKGSSIILQ